MSSRKIPCVSSLFFLSLTLKVGLVYFLYSFRVSSARIPPQASINPTQRVLTSTCLHCYTEHVYVQSMHISLSPQAFWPSWDSGKESSSSSGLTSFSCWKRKRKAQKQLARPDDRARKNLVLARMEGSSASLAPSPTSSCFLFHCSKEKGGKTFCLPFLNVLFLFFCK